MVLEFGYPASLPGPFHAVSEPRTRWKYLLGAATGVREAGVPALEFSEINNLIYCPAFFFNSDMC